MFSLVMKTDLSVLPKIVETNIDEIAPMIDDALGKVSGLIVDEAGLSAAKADAAEFRKMADKIGTFRKEHIKLWKDPMAAFEAKCKDYEKRLTEAARELTDKVNEIVDQRKAEKKSQMLVRFNAALDEKFGEAKFEAVRKSPYWGAWFDANTDPKQKGNWLNANIGIEFAYNQTIQEADRVLSQLDVIKANYEAADRETKKKAYLTFCQGFDLANTLTAMGAWVKERAMLAAEREADRQDQEQKPVAPVAVAAPVAAVDAGQVEQPKPVPVPEVKPNEPVKCWLVKVTGTCSQVKAVVQFARSVGVQIEQKK